MDAPTFGHGDTAAFHDRLYRFNRKAAGARKRALWSDSKANREAYGTPSANAVFILHEDAANNMDAKRLGKVLKMANAFDLNLVTNATLEAA